MKILGCAVAAAIAACGAVSDPVRTEAGMVSGTTGSNPEVRVYKGIPFAAPPVGPLRWREPQPAAHWEGVRKSDQFGPMCMQTVNEGRGGGARVPASEDCLYLNVWTAAANANERRPVMVWNYGGGYNTGTGASPQFDGEALAKKGVVLVTYNYRLGIFGFFAHPDLTKESAHHASGNYAVMDLAAALKWIQKNIENFGGDPKRVTIFGVSAGGGVVANLVGSPEGKGLFQRAISESCGWMGLSITAPLTLAQAEANGVKMGDLATLRAKPAADLLKEGRGSGPIVDGWYVPAALSSIYSSGKQNPVEVLVGSNKDEGTFFARAGGTAEQWQQRARQKFGDLADQFLKLYPGSTDSEAAASQLMDFRDELAWHQQEWAKVQSKVSKAYLYYFTHEPPVPEGTPWRGATHGGETAYVFQNLMPGRVTFTDVDRQLADTMSSYWVNFAATGDPNGKGLPAWPVYEEKSSERPMVLGNKPDVGAGLDAERIKFYDAYWAKVMAK